MKFLWEFFTPFEVTVKAFYILEAKNLIFFTGQTMKLNST